MFYPFEQDPAAGLSLGAHHVLVILARFLQNNDNAQNKQNKCNQRQLRSKSCLHF